MARLTVAALAEQQLQLLDKQEALLRELMEMKRFAEQTIVEATTLREQRDQVQAQLDKLTTRIVDQSQSIHWRERAEAARAIAKARGVVVKV